MRRTEIPHHHQLQQPQKIKYNYLPAQKKYLRLKEWLGKEQIRKAQYGGIFFCHARSLGVTNNYYRIVELLENQPSVIIVDIF